MPDGLRELVAKWREKAEACNSQGACAEAWGYEECANELDAALRVPEGQQVEKETDRAERLRKFRADYFNTPPAAISQLAADAMIVVIDQETRAKEAQAQVPEGGPVEPWQPIATAPKMRKLIVFYRNSLGKGRCVMACYYKAHSLEMDDDYGDVGEYDEAAGTSYAPEGWYEEHDGAEPLMPLQETPTHWMPLPEAPPASQGGEP